MNGIPWIWGICSFIYHRTTRYTFVMLKEKDIPILQTMWEIWKNDCRKFARNKLPLSSDKMKVRFVKKSWPMKLKESNAAWVYQPIRRKGINSKFPTPWRDSINMSRKSTTWCIETSSHSEANWKLFILRDLVLIMNRNQDAIWTE